MIIYDYEKQYGLADLVNNNIVKCDCAVTECLNVIPNLTKSEQEVLKIASPNTPDLYYLEAILVSLGWNKNDDVFGRQYLLNALATPVDKPFNLKHDFENIIGHITSSCLLDAAGNVITVEQALQSDIFDIGISSVLYKMLDIEPTSMAEIIEQINSGEWKVSMECVFADFDYAVITPNGQNKVIARDQNSAFLTKHLKVYGGDGVYDGYRIGRLLKDFYFSAVGLVRNPANPRSIIRNTPFTEVKANLGDIYMAVAQEDFDKVTAEVTSLSEKLAKAETSVANLTGELTVANEKLAQVEAQLAAAKTECEDEKKKKKEMEDEVEAAKTEVKNMKRTAALVGLVDEAKAKELVATFTKADDAIFNSMVAVLATKTESKEVKKTEAEEITLVPEKAAAGLIDGGHDANAPTHNHDQAIKAVAEFIKIKKG